MGIFFKKKAATPQEVKSSDSIEGGMADLLRGTSNASINDSLSSQVDNGYDVNPYVYRSVDIKAQAIASIDPIVYNTKGEVIEDRNDPLVKLLRNPNPRQSWRELIYQVESYLGINGNAFIYPITTIKGVDQLWCIPPDKVTYTRSTSVFDPVLKWTINTGNGSIDVLPNDLIHFHTFASKDPVLGTSPLKPAGLSIAQQNSAREWNKSMMLNGAKPSLKLTVPDELTEDEFNRLKDHLEYGYSGSGNAGKVMVLDGGKDANPVGFNASDMEFNLGLGVNAREIEMVCGVASELLNDNVNKTYASTSEAKKIFAEQTILPLATDLYDKLTHFFTTNEKCKSTYKSISYIGFDVSQIDALKGDQSALISSLATASYLTVNEKREMLSYPPIEGGDVVLTPMGVIPLSEAIAPLPMQGDE